jgi:ferric-chelate reductase
MPSVSAFPFESHPFTIATADLRNDDSTITEKNGAKVLSEGKEIAFIIQARSGFTQRLAEVASTSGTLKVFFDGPYSTPPHLAFYDTVVFLAGALACCSSTCSRASSSSRWYRHLIH